MSIECEKELIELKATLLKMFEADEKAGCGFEADDEWRANYLKLQKLIGCKCFTTVYDPETDDLWRWDE